jgi:hypothetical protein
MTREGYEEIMRKNTHILRLSIMIGLLLGACGSISDDVPSLEATPTTIVEGKIIDDEAAVMAFVQCMRDEGIEFKDPVVDSDGNVQEPEFIEGFTITREELAAPYATCSHHIEGLTFGRERGDMSARVDQMVKLATCLNEKGYDIDEPTTESIEQWGVDFRVGFDWDDADAMAAYEECSSAEE